MNVYSMKTCDYSVISDTSFLFSLELQSMIDSFASSSQGGNIHGPLTAKFC